MHSPDLWLFSTSLFHSISNFGTTCWDLSSGFICHRSSRTSDFLYPNITILKTIEPSFSKIKPFHIYCCCLFSEFSWSSKLGLRVFFLCGQRLSLSLVQTGVRLVRACVKFRYFYFRRTDLNGCRAHFDACIWSKKIKNQRTHAPSTRQSERGFTQMVMTQMIIYSPCEPPEGESGQDATAGLRARLLQQHKQILY